MTEQLTANEKALKAYCIARAKEQREKVKDMDRDDDLVGTSLEEGKRDAFEELLDWWFK